MKGPIKDRLVRFGRGRQIRRDAFLPDRTIEAAVNGFQAAEVGTPTTRPTS